MLHRCISLPILFFGLLAAGCATSIKLEVERPPALNTAGIKRIAIAPFEVSGGSRFEIANNSKEAARYATTVASNRIRETNHFVLVDYSVIERLRRDNQSIESHVDALFVGRVARTAITNSTQQDSYKNDEGQMITYTNYITDLEFELNYSLVVARDGRLIGPVSKSGVYRNVSRNDYPEKSALIRSAVDTQLKDIGHNLAPYTATETRIFAVDKSKNETLKAEMKNALSQVKTGNYKIALEAYLGIYKRHRSAAAAENASILYEVFGDTKAAADLMEQALNDTGSPKARETLARLNKILQDQATLANDYDNTRNAMDKIAAFASGEIRKVLPDEAKVWFYKNSSANAMLEAVADNITADFIRYGIGVVDRQNDALIAAEQKLHMSGAVNDDDIVSAGNAVGANTIVIIGISGTGAMRRLQVRVLDIKKGIPVMQSDTSEKWQI